MEMLAHWSIAHRRLVIAGWTVLLVCSIALTGTLKSAFVNDLTLPNTDAQRASTLLQEQFPAVAGDSDQIVFHATRKTLAVPAIRNKVTVTLNAVSRLPHVARVSSPYSTAGAISHDRTIGFATVHFDERGDALPADAVKRVISVAESAGSQRLQVALGGNAIEQSQKPTLGVATAVGILAAMVVLYLCFGSFLAMALPILAALLGVGTASGLIAALTHVLNTPSFASQLALLIGLGVGVDYALFLVTRYRDAYRENGGDVNAAIELAMNTAGRSIAFAGTTVVIAVLGLFVVGVPFLYGVALATSLTVLLVLAASLTLLPASLSLAGRRIGRRRAGGGPDGRTGAWARWVWLLQRRPALAALASTALLLALAAPALDLRLAASDASDDSASTTTHRAYELLSRGFGPGFNGPLALAVRLPATGAASALDRLRAAARHAPGVASVGTAAVNATRTTAAISVFPTTAPDSAQTYSLVARLRATVIPPVARATGSTVYIGGFTASQVDFAHVLTAKLPLFIGVVILLSALLLLIVFRSLLIPLQAAAMNLLSIGAAFGVVQAIFERGWGANLLGISRSPIQAFLPVIAFAIVFGLSMDYEVFLVSRIHEEWTHGASPATAIRNGLLRTGRVVTAAAAVMIAVFGAFALSNNHILQLFGLTLAVAVFLDAIVIRSILLPAVLHLFGRATWAFPAWADRHLPRLAIEPPTRVRPTQEAASLLTGEANVPGAA
jgi:RND superfamily putative drug exporter